MMYEYLGVSRNMYENYVGVLFRSMLEYVGICMYLHVFVCICMYLHVFVCICMYLHVFVCICLYLYVFVCICLYLFVFVCICLYLYVFVCTCMFRFQFLPIDFLRCFYPMIHSFLRYLCEQKFPQSKLCFDHGPPPSFCSVQAYA
jgi:hypothetical protein